MNTAEQLAPSISEALSWAEICSSYPEQWMCLVEIERGDLAPETIRSARVVGHGKTRRGPLEQARSWRDQYRVIGHYYTGPVLAPVPRIFT